MHRNHLLLERWVSLSTKKLTLVAEARLCANRPSPWRIARRIHGLLSLALLSYDNAAEVARWLYHYCVAFFELYYPVAVVLWSLFLFYCYSGFGI